VDVVQDALVDQAGGGVVEGVFESFGDDLAHLLVAGTGVAGVEELSR
jgi:hypothetical protein